MAYHNDTNELFYKHDSMLVLLWMFYHIFVGIVANVPDCFIYTHWDSLQYQRAETRTSLMSCFQALAMKSIFERCSFIRFFILRIFQVTLYQVLSIASQWIKKMFNINAGKRVIMPDIVSYISSLEVYGRLITEW